MVTMVMTTAGVAELKARLSEYLARVRAGSEVLVTERGRPVAKIVPVDTAAISQSSSERESCVPVRSICHRRSSTWSPLEWLGRD